MKCEKPGCTADAECRAPKNRALKTYWNFCKTHAAEYNQNWNFYEGMTAKEVEQDWEKRTFGTILEDGKKHSYKDIINDILAGKVIESTGFPRDVDDAFRTLGIVPTRDLAAAKKVYLELAKKYHPDTSNNSSDRFKQISSAFQIIQKFLK
ncbi:MAG: J domain-containing protein [Rickettsiales bacterium]|jgi:DnaJ-domain-containing protein 1|nr:J domain-containing protein [Rickettsiales bacterium]